MSGGKRKTPHSLLNSYGPLVADGKVRDQIKKHEADYYSSQDNKFRGQTEFEGTIVGEVQQITVAGDGADRTAVKAPIRVESLNGSVIPEPCEFKGEAASEVFKDPKVTYLLNGCHDYGYAILKPHDEQPTPGSKYKCNFRQGPGYLGRQRGLGFDPKEVSTNKGLIENPCPAMKAILDAAAQNAPTLLGGVSPYGDEFLEIEAAQNPMLERTKDAEGKDLYLGYSARKSTNKIKRIVIHYTAGWNSKSAIKTLMKSHLSYHYFIEKNGDLIQLLDPDKYVAWHAPPYNHESIGISFVNVGFERQGVKAKDNWITAPRKELNGSKIVRWEPYTDEALKTYVSVMRTIVNKYGILRENVVPHSSWPLADTIYPGTRDWSKTPLKVNTKDDPGPAFPMKETLDAIYGTT